MEIYRNQPTTVALPAPVQDAYYHVVSVKSDNGETRYINEDNPQGLPGLEFPIKYKHLQYDGQVSVEVSMDAGNTYVEYIDVVTPLFTAADIGKSYPAEKVQELERLVRKVVEAYTGQSFGPKFGRYSMDHGEDILRFDAPLIEFRGVSARYLTHTTTLTPPKVRYEALDGGFKVIVDMDLYDQKTDSMWILSQNKHKAMAFEGVFGYNRVPQDVKQAALLIAGTWSDDQAVWRDRFIETMRSADWTVTYNENAFASTGSATADMLLKKYHRRAVPEVL